MTRFFLPESTLEEWMAQELADFREGQLHLLKENGATLPAVPAVHFVRLVSGSDDAKLLTKVKTKQQLEPLAAEVLADSAIVGETAYEVVSGYIAESIEASKTPDPGKQKSAPEADLLAAFILDKMG